MTTTIRGTDNSAAAPALTGNDPDTGIYFPAANTLGLVTGGTEAVRVDSSGNVGIGTSSPSSKLNVVDASTNCVIRATNSSSSFEIQSNSNFGYVNLNGSGDIVFRSGTPSVAERMRINSSGTMLVGLTDSSNYAKLCTTSLGVYEANDASDGGIYLVKQSGAPTRLGSIRSYGSDSGLTFWTNSGGTNYERARIDSSGYVTMPYQPLISIGINTTGIADTGSVNMFGVSGRAYIVDVAQGITHNTSNGRFTIPVAGKYFVAFFSMKESSGTAYIDVTVNGASWLRPYSSNNASNWSAYNVQGIKTFAAGDYIEVIAVQNTATYIAHGLQHLRFVAYLIG